MNEVHFNLKSVTIESGGKKTSLHDIDKVDNQEENFNASSKKVSSFHKPKKVEKEDDQDQKDKN